MSENPIDRNCLSYWFPKLQASGVPVPQTSIVSALGDLSGLLDGEMPSGYESFMEALRAATDASGYPCFLRTGHTSDKHDWRETCFVQRADDLPTHVTRLVEFSSMAGLFGLPSNVWAVRKFVPLYHRFTAFNGMPVTRERRYFFREGEVICHHSYWPIDAVAQGRPSVTNWEPLLKKMNFEPSGEVAFLTARTRAVAKHFLGDGAWSLDWAMLNDGSWIAIDMALIGHSYHDQSCPNAPIPIKTKTYSKQNQLLELND
jgi:hypothetical protein